jgi:cellulose synthase/poly-beta-1,6-N-acetylglucosamine synthase-like glycosyltransferase
MLSGVVAAITIVYTVILVLNLILVTRLFHSSPEEQIDDEIVHALRDAEWPMYTILCPLYREALVVPQFVKAIQSLDYPTDKLQVLFLTEENDSETRNVIRDLDLPAHFKIIVVPDGQPRTKPRACNYGLLYAEGSYVVIYDAEDIPDPLQLKKAVLTFANHGTNVACVQAKLNFYNSGQNLLTRWFTAEYSMWFDLVLPGLQLARFPLPLGGTSNHFRIDALRALGAWDAYNVTEDCDLGLRLKRYGMETVILDSTTLEEASPNLKNWIRQRSRWIKGYMQTYLVHMRNPLQQLHKRSLYELFSFQVVVGSGLGVMMFNPFMWALLAIYITSSSEAVSIYHILFLGPVLYTGAFCLIFGNFFYLYLYLLACTKRKLYHLLPSTLFIPIYWLLMSIAAFYALFELLVKPHYWQKTIHGFHLRKKQAGSRTRSQTALAAFLNEETMPMPVVSGRAVKTDAVSPVTEALKAIPMQKIPPVSLRQENAQVGAERARVRDRWQVATIVVACISSIAACWYFFEHHEITLYEDALSHMRISRSVFDNITPGLAQLGSVWLPLPHILMWPFIWNNSLWQTGLAGSFAAMPCYVIAAIYVFRFARKLTRNSAAAFVGSLAFILNPNVLFLQSTPLSETVCMATLAMACYYFLCWIEDGTTRSLVLTAACTFLATLARYDGWSLFVAIWVFLPVISLIKRCRISQIISNSILFSLPGGMGIVLWFVWNKIIFGDPLYFQSSAYSSQAQQLQQLQANRLFAYHNLWEALRYYTIDTVQSAGLLLCVLAVLGLLWFLFSRRLKAETFGLLVFLVPFAFYILAQYTGQAIIWLPASVPAGSHITFYNARYGSQMVAPIAVLFAIFVANLRLPSRKRLNALLKVFFVGVVILQSFMIISQGVISLQDGEDNYSCFEQFDIANYLAQHYQGGHILEDLFANQVDPTVIRVDFKDIVYEGSGQLWTQAVEYPASTVTWIIVKPTNSADLVTQYIDLHSPSFLSEFTVVAQQADGLVLYHRLGTPLTPLHAGVPKWTIPHDACSS